MWKPLALFVVLLFFTLHAHAQKDAVKPKLKDTLTLNETVVTARVAVKIGKDTISYAVDSFTKNPDANLEDVLKKMPGIEIAADGSITVQGKPVTKIYINGKEYSVDDLRTLTRNLPAEVLDKIQAADYYDEDAVFTGIKPNSDKKMLNLQLKKKYNGGTYGRVNAGYGTSERYQGGAFVNYFTDSVRITGIGNFSNTGLTDASQSDADNTRSGLRPQNGVNAKQGGGISIAYTPGKRLKLSLSYDANHSNNVLMQSLLRNTYLPGDSVLLRAQGGSSTSSGMSHKVIFRADRTSAAGNRLQFGGAFNYNTRTNNNDDHDTTAYTYCDNISFKRDAVSNSSSATPGGSMYASYGKKFRKERRSLTVNGGGSYGSTNADGDINNINQYYLPYTLNNTRFTNTDDSRTVNANAGIRYAEPLGKNHLVYASYAYYYNKNNGDKQVLNDTGVVPVRDTVQSRAYTSHSGEQPVSVNYQYSGKKLTANAGIEARPYQRYNEYTLQRTTSISQRGTNYAPSASVRYSAGNGQNAALSYSGNISSPDISQLQPLPDYTDSLNIYIGNPSLRPEVRHNLNGSYNLFNSKKGRSLNTSLYGSTTQNKIISKTDINASRRITMPVNANGYYSLYGSANYTTPLFTKKLKATISIAASYANNVSYTNGQLLTVGNYGVKPELKLVYLGTGHYEGDLSSSYRSGGVRGVGAIDNSLRTYNITHSGMVSLPWSVRINYYINYTLNDGIAAGLQKDFLLTNASIEKSFKKPKGVILKLQAFDIFNNYPTTTRTTGDNYIEDRSVNRVGSYYMCTLVYKFSYFAAKKEQD